MSIFSASGLSKLFKGQERQNLKSQIDNDGILHSEVSDEDLAHLMPLHEDESERISPEEQRGAEEVSWAPEDFLSPDYAHLHSKGASEQPFTLRAEDLKLLAELNDFPVASNEEVPILFGLRGCKIVKSSEKLEPEVELLDIRPTHGRPRCVLGVWDRVAHRIAVFPGSTVPDLYGVLNHFNTGGGGNILPTGYYGYIVGKHNNRPGCFLLRESIGLKRKVIVRRSRNNKYYDLHDKIDVCQPGDNIHPTFRNHLNSFSSWGCQTVAGNANSGGNHSGSWARFRAAAGMYDDDGEPGKHYNYMLLTGTEAMRVSQARSKDLARDPITHLSLRRLRFGSASHTVKKLQSLLGQSNPDGIIGPITARSLYVRQSAVWGGASDGIYSPDFDAEIGGGVFGDDFAISTAQRCIDPRDITKTAQSIDLAQQATTGAESVSDDEHGIDPHEYLGDIMGEEEDEAFRDQPLILDYEALGLDARSEPDDRGVKLWYPGADTSYRMPSRGKYKNRYPVGAVVHFTAGRSLKGDVHARSTVKEGAKNGYSFFVISRTGKVYQSTPLSHWGSHAGKSYHPDLGKWVSSKLVGIEICNAGLLKETSEGYEPWWNKPGYSTNTYFTEDDVRYVNKKDNITQAGFYHQYSPEQEQALQQLLGWLKQNNPNVFRYKYVLGHDEVAPKRKQDPGGSLSMTMPRFRKTLQDMKLKTMA